jgi:cytochrome P450
MTTADRETSVIGASTSDAGSTASLRETFGVLFGLVIPLVARGVIIRRPRMVRLAERLDADRRAVRRMQALADRHGPGPIRLKIPVRHTALVVDPDDVHRVLQGSPDPFTPASLEKRAALSHFQPEGVLISEGAERADRRRFNERVLDEDAPVHRLGESFVAVAREEARGLLAGSERTRELTWDDFVEAWFRVVRRVTFGDSARDDHELTDLSAQLRGHANWAFASRKRRRVRATFHDRIEYYVRRAEPGSLTQVMAETPTTGQTAAVQQVPQWLFAFDPAGMATFRALALLAAHPTDAETARAEARAAAGEPAPELMFLRTCVLESLRLWPTTPAILRDTTEPTTWGGGNRLRAGTNMVVYAPFFHRNERRLDVADRFSPELWSRNRGTDDWPLVPFSGGPAMCPGRNLVLLTTSTFLSVLIEQHRFDLVQSTRLDDREPLPSVLDPYSLRFDVSPLG